MTNEDRIDALADRVWPDEPLSIQHGPCESVTIIALGSSPSVVFNYCGHARTIRALEALANEPPQWAAELVEQWRVRSEDVTREHDDYHYAAAVDRCADDLLAAARGQQT
jgi:hypothetical protein